MKHVNIFCLELLEQKNRSYVIVTTFIKPWVLWKFWRRNDTSVKYSDVEGFFGREEAARFRLALPYGFLTLCSHGIMSQNAKKYGYPLFLLLWQVFCWLTSLFNSNKLCYNFYRIGVIPPFWVKITCILGKEKLSIKVICWNIHF